MGRSQKLSVAPLLKFLFVLTMMTRTVKTLSLTPHSFGKILEVEGSVVDIVDTSEASILDYDIETNETLRSSTNQTAVNIQEVKKEKLNLRPIIGILSQEPGNSMKKALLKASLNVTSYIAASYVKSVEGAGARVVPILINQEPEYYQKLANSLNGILFPGGAASIRNTSGYGRAGDALYQLVVESNLNNNTMPLWATCLGFEMLVYLAAGRKEPLSPCKANDRADPLYFKPGYNASRLWRDASPGLLTAVKTENITSNFHKFCVTPEKFAALKVSDDFDVLSTNFDDDGIEYVSTIEHKQYPIFGTQWHPEKNNYEWKNSTIPHGLSASRLEHHTMEVFVEQARRNFNSFSSEDEASEYLIYNYTPLYVAKLYASSFQQIYYF